MQKNKYTIILSAFVFLLTLCCSYQVQATHLMGGNITYSYLGTTPTGQKQYAITANLFRDCNGINMPSTAAVNLSSSCGSTVATLVNNGGGIAVTPLCSNEVDVCDPGSGGTYGVHMWIYRGTVTLPNCGSDWVMYWSSCCRNNAITTLTGAGSFYVEARLDNTVAGGNSSPAFNNDPTTFLCANQENRYNNGLTDTEDDSLVYSLVDCLQSATNPVTYIAGLSGGDPLIGATTIDPETGDVFALPTTSQVAVVCMLVEEYRNGVKIGQIVRDLQFTVTDCQTNTLPTISGFGGGADSSGVSGSYTTTICAGKKTCLDIQGFDAEAVPSAQFQDLTLTWNYGISGASFVVDYNLPYPVGQFCWEPTQSDVGKHSFFVRAGDDACPILGSNVFTYKLDVVSAVDIELNHTDTILAPGDSLGLNVSFNVGGASDLTWSPTIGLSCTDCISPIVTPPVGTTTYTVTATSDNGCLDSEEITITTFAVSTDELPEQVANWNVFPNPLTEQSVVEYELLSKGNVTLDLFNVVGQHVSTIENATQNSGKYQYSLGDHLAGKAKGLYIVRMNVDGKNISKKVMYR